MKLRKIKIIFALSIIGFVIFLMTRLSKLSNLDGKWDVYEIVIDGKVVYPENLVHNRFSIKPTAEFNPWVDSIFIMTSTQNSIRTHYKLKEEKKGYHQITLNSADKSINGTYNLSIDTTHVGPQEYIVDLKIFRDSTRIHFRKERVIPPWKPQFPRKGQL